MSSDAISLISTFDAKVNEFIHFIKKYRYVHSDEKSMDEVNSRLNVIYQSLKNI